MKAALAVILLSLEVTSCGTGERPFRMVQLCLGSIQQIEELKTVSQSIAAANGLDFYDRSADAEAEATSLSEGGSKIPVAHPMLLISARAPDGQMGFSAANFAEAPSQVTFGFSKGADENAARKISDNVVQALSKRWRVREVADVAQSGALPLEDCGE